MWQKVIPSLILLLLFGACNEIEPEYPDEPLIDYQSFVLYISVDELGNKSLFGKLSFEFTDGDGNLGLKALDDDSTTTNLPDTLKYNFFLQVHHYDNGAFIKVPEEEGGILKYRIPYLDKHPLKGTLDLEIYYPVVTYDSLFYSFYIYDRDFNRSNTDSTELVILSGIDLDAD
ncbi:MAG: hypothetical protein CSA96_10180 [Bacteroidetes bacterium]|nr:MAG: hypothetical protein CSA96_10180 [Bacteroidota bacterium]